jgi:ribosomal protein S18 acetylase RimI-like enzyme
VSTPTTTFAIRPVRPDEYPALGELTVAAYHSLQADMPHQDVYDGVLRDVARRADASLVLVAVTPAGELLGGVTYVGGPDNPYSEELREGEAGIRMLAVHPGRQGRGVGRALTRACVDRACAEGRAAVILHTGTWMPVAIRLYESLGFARQPERDFSPAPGVALIAYSLDPAAGAASPE